MGKGKDKVPWTRLDLSVEVSLSVATEAWWMDTVGFGHVSKSLPRKDLPIIHPFCLFSNFLGTDNCVCEVIRDQGCKREEYSISWDCHLRGSPDPVFFTFLTAYWNGRVGRTMSHILIFVELLTNQRIFFFLISRVATSGLLEVSVLKGFGNVFRIDTGGECFLRPKEIHK